MTSQARSKKGSAEPSSTSAARTLGIAGRLGLAGRTGFYAILTGLTIRIAVLGGGPASPRRGSRHQVDANGALALVSKPLIGKVAIGAVALGFVLFGAGRLVGAVRDDSVSKARRAMTVLQGLFYLALAYVPCNFLAGNGQTGSQQQQQKSTAELLGFRGGRELVIAVGVILMIVCGQQIRNAISQEFAEGLDLDKAPAAARWAARVSGTLGIPARALVFLPVGIFLIVSAAQFDPAHSYGTDAELLRLSAHVWGVTVLAAVALGLAIFVVYSALETRYRVVVSAK